MIYEVKLNIKKYATLNIYTTSENIKNKLIDIKSSIKRTIPVTDASWKIVDKKDKTPVTETPVLENNETKTEVVEETTEIK